MTFDPKKEVPDLELCKVLKSLGFPQDGSGWYWVKELNDKRYKLIFMDIVNKTYGIYIKEIKAPTVRELGEWLPTEIGGYDNLFIEKHDNGYNIGYGIYSYDEWGYSDRTITIYVSAENEANARAKLLIELLKKGHVVIR